jgi:phosphopantothenate synthetase
LNIVDHLSGEAFDWVVGEVEQIFNKAVVAAAQSFEN